MRYLIPISALVAATMLTACSNSEGEDDDFFERAGPNNLSTFVRANCQNTPETANAVLINGVDFGSGALSETAEPDNSSFTNSCIEDSGS